MMIINLSMINNNCVDYLLQQSGLSRHKADFGRSIVARLKSSLMLQSPHSCTERF
jgi:hypothetical protein